MVAIQQTERLEPAITSSVLHPIEITGSHSIQEYIDFVKSMKVYPEKYAVVYPALGLSGESGEIAEKVKKSLRGDKELDKPEVVKELGDVLWYVTSLADDLGYTLQDVIELNIQKLSSRKERGVVNG